MNNVASTDSTFSRKWPCMFCKADHHISRCHNFLEMSIDDRWKYAKDAQLCYSCLTSKHSIKGCRFKKPCGKCQLFHLSVLHRNVTTMPSERSSAPPVRAESHRTLFTGVSQGSKNSMILPVYLSLADDIENEWLVYVLLDSQSDTTFINDDTCNEMGLSGPNVQLVLSPMSATDEVVSTRKISDVTHVLMTLPFSLLEIRRSAITPSTALHAFAPACALRRTSLPLRLPVSAHCPS